MEKDPMVHIGENIDEEHHLAETSQLLDQVLILLRNSVNNYTYDRRFNILMAFVNSKKKIETMIKENSQDFIDDSNSNMLVGPKFRETVAKSLSLILWGTEPATTIVKITCIERC